MAGAVHEAAEGGARRGRRRGLVTSVCLVLLALSSCTGGSGRTAQPEPGHSSTAAPERDPSPTPSEEATPSASEPADPHADEAVCDGDGTPYNPSSAPYRGTGPHPVQIVHLEEELALGAVALEFDPATGDYWDPAAVVPERGTLDKVQLVICQEATATATNDETIGICKFEGDPYIPGSSGQLWVVPATHDFTVFEARTGERVADFTLPGTASAEDSCPGSAKDYQNIAQNVDGDALIRKLRPFYEDDARSS